MQRSKKVLFTSHVANFSKFNRPFMRWFSQQGYEVHYASVGEEKVLDCDKHFTIPFERSPFKLDNIRAIWHLKKIIDAEGYDIIHTHTPMGSVVTRLAAIRSRKYSKTRIIYTAHGFHFYSGAPLLSWLIYYPIERFMARFTDILITINHEDYARAEDTFKTNVVYIPGVGVDGKKFKQRMSDENKLRLRQSLGIGKSDFVMIYPAELSERKRQTWLISALCPLIKTDNRYHLLLPGIDSLSGECQKLARHFGIGDNVHFLGYRNDISELMMISDLAVSSSTQEGLPVNLLEAMSIGLPIVATDCRGNRDLVSDGLNGFIVATNDPESFAKKVLQISHDKKLGLAMAKSSKETIKNYSLDKIVHKMSAIYGSTYKTEESYYESIEIGEAYGRSV